VCRRYLVLPPLFIIGIALLRPATVPEQVKAASTRSDSAGVPSIAEGPPVSPGEPISRGGTLAEFQAVAETFRLVDESEKRYARNLQLRLLARRLDLAFLWFEQARYKRCIWLCSSILRLDPWYPVALRLKECAEQCRKEVGLALIQLWRPMTDDGDRPRIPDAEAFVVRDGEAWHTFVEEEVDEVPVRYKLETMKMDLNFENTKLEDILTFVRDYSGIDIYLDVVCREWIDPGTVLSFQTKDAVLKDVLRELFSRFRLDYVVTEDKAVLVTFPYRVAAFRRQN
jgi:hypothetical protein